MDRASLLSTRKQGQLPMYMDIWSADFNDPDNFIYKFLAPRNAIARSDNYKNETFRSNDLVHPTLLLHIY
ncbi:MAG: hypothetical protein H6Q71_1361 [Firmicutes bacterium]|nr:hypothetical protein [Bacillota bacterium]